MLPEPSNRRSNNRLSFLNTASNRLSFLGNDNLRVNRFSSVSLLPDNDHDNRAVVVVGDPPPYEYRHIDNLNE
jgi:hypothetical protein